MAALNTSSGLVDSEQFVNTDSFSYFSMDYAKKLLKNFNDLRLSLRFCDVEINIGKESFGAHKALLSAGSPYFQAMFTGGLIEEHKNTVEVHGVPPEIFNLLVNFIYTGEIELTVENVQDVLSAANMLELCDLVAACSKFLKQQLHSSNCLGIYQFAETHASLDLQAAAEFYIHTHFLEVIQEEEFCEAQKDTLTRILFSENLRIENEFQVFQAAMQWILHDPPQRRRHIFDILQTVRIPLINMKKLMSFAEECSDFSLRIVLKKYLLDFNACKKSCDFKVWKTFYLNSQPRNCAQKFLYVVGGYSRHLGGRWSDNQTLTTVERFDSFKQLWRGLPQMKFSRSNHGVVVLNGLVYAIGGESDSLIYDSAEMYDPLKNLWTRIADMTIPRCGFGCCSLDDLIYVLGGWVGSEIGDSMECYDPQLNQWKKIGKMNTLRNSFGVVAVQGLIYVVGGQTELGTELYTMESYNPVTGNWVKVADMKTPRANVAVSHLYDCIYAVGGWNEMHGTLASVEKYSLEEEKWTTIPPLSIPRAGAAVATVNGLLYVIGGRSSPAEEFTAPATLNSVECYDPQTNSWLEITPMPTSRCDMGAAVL